MLFTKQIAEANARATAAQGQFDLLKAAIETGGHFALAGSGKEGDPFTLSLTEAGKTHFGASAAELTAQLQDATASVQSLIEEKVGLEAKLSAAVPDERKRITAAFTEGKHFALDFDADGKPTPSLTADGEAHFINAKTARVVAGAGHQPLPVAVDSPAPGNKASAGTGAGRTKTTWAPKN